MKLLRSKGALIKYLPFCALLSIYLYSLCFDLSTATDEVEHIVGIWKDALLINTTVGLLGGIYVQDKLMKLMGGEPINFVKDVAEMDSKDVSVSFNGLISISIISSCIIILFFLYIITHIRLFLILSIILSVVIAIGIVVVFLASYLQQRQEKTNSIISKLLNSITLPMIICFFLLFVTNNSTVAIIYNSIEAPVSTIIRILAIIAVLCYVTAIAYCHFSNLYCLISFTFARKNPEIIQNKLNLIMEKNAKREDILRQKAKYIDEKSIQVGFIKRCGLAVQFFYTHIKAYFKERFYSTQYILSFLKLKFIKTLAGLLELDRIRTNTIRFCEIMVVLELLILNMLLFIYLGNEDPCSRFFELLSTVIIIPIILSSLANIKKKKE